jgi:branched-chain amino acid transport system ATP-binding protein/neutral amino acid transport system ATP-binding protein
MVTSGTCATLRLGNNQFCGERIRWQAVRGDGARNGRGVDASGEPQHLSSAEPTSAPPLLSIRGLRRSFYGVTALAGVDLDVAPGTITGLIGPNGAGKTTLFNCITGLIPPDGGSVAFAGRDITGWRADRVTRAGLVRTFQTARGFPRLSVMENLLLYGADQPGEAIGHALLRPRAGAARENALIARARAIAARLKLAALLDNPASDLSGGQKKLLELGRALMTDPKLILLDEPIAGINPTLANELADHLRALRGEGITFLVIEHQMDMIARLCDPVIVMAEGRRLVEGSFAEVAADPRVQEAYMGRRRWVS